MRLKATGSTVDPHWTGDFVVDQTAEHCQGGAQLAAVVGIEGVDERRHDSRPGRPQVCELRPARAGERDQHRATVIRVAGATDEAERLESLDLRGHGGLAAVVGLGEVADPGGLQLLDLREQAREPGGKGEVGVPGGPAVQPGDDPQQVRAQLGGGRRVMARLSCVPLGGRRLLV